MKTFLIIAAVIIFLGILGNYGRKREEKKREADQVEREKLRKAILEEERRKAKEMTEATEKALEQYPAEVKELIHGLIEVGRKYPPDNQSASRYLNIGRAQAVEIGKTLSEKGGNT